MSWWEDTARYWKRRREAERFHAEIAQAIVERCGLAYPDPPGTTMKPLACNLPAGHEGQHIFGTPPCQRCGWTVTEPEGLCRVCSPSPWPGT